MLVTRGEPIMKSITPNLFQELMRYVQMICSPTNGYYVEFSKRNPYYKEQFRIPEDCEPYLFRDAHGYVLYLYQNERLALTAFYIAG